MENADGFDLKIVTPDGCAFSGEVKMLLVRTTSGDVGILKNHINYLASIDYGMVKLTLPDNTYRSAACMGGFVSVDHNLVRVVATTFEYADKIDILRAKAAKEKAEKRIDEQKSQNDVLVAEMKLKRALNRIHIYDEFH